MNYKAIIFDMDGTIVDTNGLWNQVVEQLVHGKGITDQQLVSKIQEGVCGLSITRACHLIKELARLPDPVEALEQEKSCIALALYDTQLQFIPGFIEFHTLITRHQMKSAIATNADDMTFEKTKSSLDLQRYFGTHMYNISCVGNVCKPQPAVYLHAAQELAVEPAACIAIEDSYAGILAAKRAGMKCIGINTNKDRSKLALADLIIEGYHELTIARLEKL
jgi:HAD superfamily hydrolase (TIGR01509 family)